MSNQTAPAQNREILISATDCPDLKFVGTRLARSGPKTPLNGNWTEFELYLTDKNQIVVVVRHCSSSGRRDRVSWIVASSWTELKSILDDGGAGRIKIKWSWLTRALVEEAASICPAAREILVQSL